MVVSKKKIFNAISTTLWLAMDTFWSFSLSGLAVTIGIFLVLSQCISLKFANRKKEMAREIAVTMWMIMNLVWVIEDFISKELFYLKLLIIISAWIITIFSFTKGITNYKS